MQWKKPKNTEKYYWTQHSLMKMQFYGLSPQRIARVIKSPQRIEEGIVEKTIAVMQRSSTSTKNGKKIWSSEIWVMYQVKNQKLKSKVITQNLKFKELQNKINLDKKIIIISAWRYPGVSPKKNPIPEEILREIEETGIIK